MDLDQDLFSYFTWDEDHVTQALESLEQERGATRYVSLSNSPFPCTILTLLLSSSGFNNESKEGSVASGGLAAIIPGESTVT